MLRQNGARDQCHKVDHNFVIVRTNLARIINNNNVGKRLDRSKTLRVGGGEYADQLMDITKNIE